MAEEKYWKLWEFSTPKNSETFETGTKRKELSSGKLPENPRIFNFR